MPYKDTEKKAEYQKIWKDKNPEYHRKWAEKNRDKIRSASKKWKDKNKEKCATKMSRRRNDLPWETHFYGAKTRCENKNVPKYKYYGARGIKFSLEMGDVKEAWHRDKAIKMDRPSIDRIDNDGDYCKANIQFIELSENSKKSHKERKCK